MRLLRYIPGFEAWNRLLFRRDYPSLKRDVFGVMFSHPVGLAPVIERQDELLGIWDGLGFAFTGILPGRTDNLKTLADRLATRNPAFKVFIELRAEGDSEERAKANLIRQYSLLYDFTDFFVIDLNRQSDLITFDDISDWTDIMDELLNLRLCYDRYVPILLRLPPEDDDNQSNRILDFCLLSGMDGVVAPGISRIRQAYEYTKGRLPIIGSGAVSSPQEAIDMLEAGASLVEVAQGVRGHGRSTPRRILKALSNPSPTKE